MGKLSGHGNQTKIKKESEDRNNWGRIFFKDNTFKLGTTIGTIAGSIPLNILLATFAIGG